MTFLSFLGLCLQGTFLKGTYCVPNCGPGYYGNNVTRTCRKCDPSCKTCLDGDGPKKCSSCNPPLHIQGKSYEICWSTQIILFPCPLFLSCTFFPDQDQAQSVEKPIFDNNRRQSFPIPIEIDREKSFDFD